MYFVNICVGPNNNNNQPNTGNDLKLIISEVPIVPKYTHIWLTRIHTLLMIPKHRPRHKYISIKAYNT